MRHEQQQMNDHLVLVVVLVLWPKIRDVYLRGNRNSNRCLSQYSWLLNLFARHSSKSRTAGCLGIIKTFPQNIHSV